MPAESLRHYKIAGLTIQIEGIPFFPGSLAPKFDLFRVTRRGHDIIKLHHHCGLPDLDLIQHKKLIYVRVPWEIFSQPSGWIYNTIPPRNLNTYLRIVAIFNKDHSVGNIYHEDDATIRAGNLQSLSLIPSDQMLLARVFAYRQACLLHACGMILQGHGLAFVGHSEAGKTTTARMLQGEGELLCDDRIIVRRWPEGFRVHGTWSHGDIPQVSAGSAPLRAVFLLEQAAENRLIRLPPSQVIRALPEFVVKGLVTRDWWENILDTLGSLAREVPVYRLRLDKSGAVVSLLREFLSQLDALPDELP